MNLLIIRHAIAKDRDDWTKEGKDDRHRPLTASGRQKMRNAARGLKKAQPEIDLLASSPLARAKQTAKIVGKVYSEKIEIVDSLAPEGDRQETLDWLLELPEQQNIAIVGHEPALGLLASWLLASPMNHFIELKKGGAALLSWDGPPEAGNGWLKWCLHPNQLRRLA